MAIFKRLIQTPSSPEKSLKALSGADKYKGQTFARLADVNDLSKDVNDQKAYTLDAATGIVGTQAITTKKGVIKIINASTSSTTFTLTVSNSELLVADIDKYFVQVNVASATVMSPSIRIVPMTANGNMNIVISIPTGLAMNTLYVHYNIVKIDN